MIKFLADKRRPSGDRVFVVCPIIAGSAVSDVVDLALFTLVGIQVGAAFTGTHLLFDASWNGTTIVPFYDDAGNRITTLAAATRYIDLEIDDFDSVRFIRLISATGVAQTAQVAEATLTLVLRRV